METPQGRRGGWGKINCFCCTKEKVLSLCSGCIENITQYHVGVGGNFRRIQCRAVIKAQSFAYVKCDIKEFNNTLFNIKRKTNGKEFFEAIDNAR